MLIFLEQKLLATSNIRSSFFITFENFVFVRSATQHIQSNKPVFKNSLLQRNIRKLGNAKRCDCESALHADMCLDKKRSQACDVEMERKIGIFRVSLFLSLGEMDAIVTHAETARIADERQTNRSIKFKLIKQREKDFLPPSG